MDTAARRHPRCSFNDSFQLVNTPNIFVDSELNGIQIRKVDHTSVRKELELGVEALYDIVSSVEEHRQTRETLAMEGITPRTMVADLQSGDSALWIASLLPPSSNTGGTTDAKDKEYYSSSNTRSSSYCGRLDIGYATADRNDRCTTALFVCPDYEGFGVGRLLLQTAEDWLWSRSNGQHGPIWLLSGKDSSLGAFGFYKRMGYTPIGTMDEVAEIDNGTMREIMMFGKMRSNTSTDSEEDSMGLFRKLLLRSKAIDDYHAIEMLLERKNKQRNLPTAMEQYRLGRSRASQPPKKRSAGRGFAK